LAKIFPLFPSELRFGSYFACPSARVAEHPMDPASARACRNHAPLTLIQVWIRQLATVVPDSLLVSLLNRSATLIPMPRSSPQRRP
jgi:hypothetical protein